MRGILPSFGLVNTDRQTDREMLKVTFFQFVSIYCKSSVDTSPYVMSLERDSSFVLAVCDENDRWSALSSRS